MELLLNLLWLMLALPAILIWRHDPTSARALGRFARSRSFVLLSCLLALLFPIVSATDDLHPIRTEIEESGPSKHVVKQSPRSSSPTLGTAGTQPAQLLHATSFSIENTMLSLVSSKLPLFPGQTLVRTVGPRAPPIS
jgi:hypothetical protein